MLILLQVILPIFAIIFCGFLAGRLQLLPLNGTSSLNYFVYYFALPALLFHSLSNASVEQLMNVEFIFANLIIVLVGFVLTVLLFKIAFKRKLPDLSMYGMITTYGNLGFLGIPLLVAAFGQEAAVPAAIVTFIYDLTIITLVVVSIEWARAKNEKQQKNVWSLFRMVVKSVILNPINASLLLGIIIGVSQISIPQPVYVFTEVLGPAAGPTALFSLGLGLSAQRGIFEKQHYQISEFITLLSLKLLILPLLSILVVYFIIPLEDRLWATTVVILSAMPTGAIVYVFAEKYNTLVKQVPLYTLATTLISIITISIFLVALTG